MEEANESEQVSDHFICAVCLEILYKPIVLVCGHVTCFWCCYHSMDMRGQSHCPLCRHPYRHFPAVCHMLEILLKKIYPNSYDIRKKQTHEDEEQRSPEHLLILYQPSDLNSGDNLSINPSREDKKSNDKSHKQVKVGDVLCAACKQLLFRPAALNCGHVYCEACITIPEDGVIKCQVCQCRNPSGFPKVCKDLDYFLQKQFPSDYVLGRRSIHFDQDQIQNRHPVTAEEDILQWGDVHGSNFHAGVGCDMCGMCPIIGDRYGCKDCKEKRGYDLCGDCHNSGSKLPGRFNQKHTQEHHLKLVKPVINQDVINRLLIGQLPVVYASLRSRSNPVDETSEVLSSSLDDQNDHNE